MNRLKKTIFTVLGIVATVGLAGFARIYHVRPYFDRTDGKLHFLYGRCRYYGDMDYATLFEDGKFIKVVHLGCG